LGVSFAELVKADEGSNDLGEFQSVDHFSVAIADRMSGLASFTNKIR
jgi:hypothetical protein